MSRSTSVSSHKLISGTSLFRGSGVLVKNSHPLRWLAHSSVLHRAIVSFSVGKSFNASATMLSEPPGA